MFKIFFLLAFIFQFSYSLDTSQYDEGTSLVPHLVKVDLQWLFSVSSWNFLAGSKYGFYRFAKSFNLKSVDELSENDLLNQCITTKLSDKGVVTLNAFGKKVEYKLTLNGNNPAIIHWRLIDAEQESDQTVGVSYVVLTDNKTYFATLQYWDYSRIGWLVMSTQKTVSAELLKEIEKTMIPYGFDMDKAFFKDFNKCPLPDKKEKQEL